jgi:hypothetical protein
VLDAETHAEDLYWRFIALAAAFPFIGLLFLRDRWELWLQAVGAVAVVVLLSAAVW